MAQKDNKIKKKKTEEIETGTQNEVLNEKESETESLTDEEQLTDKEEANLSKKVTSKTTKKASKKEKEDFEQKYYELSDKYLRLTAEFDNYRKRTLKERMDLMKSAGEDILINFLPVMDNFDRAILSINDAKDINAVKEGISLIHKNLSDFLKERGIKEMESLGEVFDTDLHEALTKIPAPNEDMKGKVVDVIEKGYTMKEKVIRYAKVVIGE